MCTRDGWTNNHPLSRVSQARETMVTLWFGSVWQKEETGHAITEAIKRARVRLDEAHNVLSESLSAAPFEKTTLNCMSSLIELLLPNYISFSD